MRELLTRKEILEAITSKTVLELCELRDVVPGQRETAALTRGIEKKGNALLKALCARKDTEGLYELLTAQLGNGSSISGRVATEWLLETNSGVYTLELGWDSDGSYNSHSWWEFSIVKGHDWGHPIKRIIESESWD